MTKVLKFRRFFYKPNDQAVTPESLCKLANIVLEHNYFELRKIFTIKSYEQQL